LSLYSTKLKKLKNQKHAYTVVSNMYTCYNYIMKGALHLHSIFSDEAQKSKNLSYEVLQNPHFLTLITILFCGIPYQILLLRQSIKNP